MKTYFGNIITDSKNLRCETYMQKCKSLEDIDKRFPTIIIGLENAKKYIKDFCILRKEYKEQNLWWTFKKTERRNDYVEDMRLFDNMIIDTLVKDVKYSYVNVMKLRFSQTKKLINYVKSDDKKDIYVDNNRFIFVYSETYKTVFGFSLSTCEYCGINKTKVLNLLKSNPNNKFIKNFNNIPNRVKKSMGNKLHSYLVLNRFFS